MVAGVTVALPEGAPLVEKPPAEVQEVALVELQESVEDCPLSMVLGVAERVAVGGLGSEQRELLPPFVPLHHHCHWLGYEAVAPRVPAEQL